MAAFKSLQIASCITSDVSDIFFLFWLLKVSLCATRQLQILKMARWPSSFFISHIISITYHIHTLLVFVTLRQGYSLTLPYPSCCYFLCTSPDFEGKFEKLFMKIFICSLSFCHKSTEKVDEKVFFFLFKMGGLTRRLCLVDNKNMATSPSYSDINLDIFYNNEHKLQ